MGHTTSRPFGREGARLASKDCQHAGFTCHWTLELPYLVGLVKVRPGARFCANVVLKSDNPRDQLMSRFIFPEWTESLKKWVLLLAAGAPVYLIALIAYGVSPEAIRLGYMPEQPVPYSHALHVGELGMDCRYCHDTVDRAGFSAVPSAQTCMNCHGNVRQDSEKLAPIRESFETGKAVQWVKVHDMPDYVFFNHSAHVTRGVGCESCHGRVDQMKEVWQEAPLTMGWCLDCHRDPAKNLREPADVTVMGFDERFDSEAARLEYGQSIQSKYNLKPNTNCTTCHR